MAIEDFNKRIQLDPNHSDAYICRGLAYYNKGQYDKAIEDYNVAIALDPDDADAYICRGRANEMLGNKSMAISDYKKACDMGLQEGCEILQKALRQR